MPGWNSYLAPRYWGTWSAIGLMWLWSRLPFDAQLALGRGVGSVLYYLLPSRRQVTLTNITLALPELDDAARRRLAHEAYRHVGMSLAETTSLWFRPRAFYADRFSVEGIDHLAAAQALGKGVILLQAHFTILDISASIVGPDFPICAVFDNPKNPLFAEFLTHQRERFVPAMIRNDDIRSMVRRLRRGEIVWYSPDQTVPKEHGGIATTFFGQAVLTTAGTARMAAMTGATIVPYVPTRHGDRGRYTLSFKPPLALDTSNADSATNAINALFESQIREQPEQYFWMHKRFKPPGDTLPNPYRR